MIDAHADRLGPYELLARAGAGGMGVVYRARHVDTGAVHALKVLLAHGDPDDALRFRREAEAMARVDGHPNLVRVHAVGEERGRPWIAMQWAPGGNLLELLKAGPLPVDDVVALGRDLALALAHVHARGVLHRDLKPHNVLYGEDGAPRLTDFGLARLRGARSLTETGVVLGTPVYMAPEQADGGKQLDERTDVYGLGALLYHALTGRPPFQASSAVATLHAVLERAPVPPRALRADAPEWLEHVLLKALAKAPDERWPTARAFAAALEAGADGHVPPRRGWQLALVVGAAALLAVAVGAAVIASSSRAAPAPAPAPPEPDPAPVALRAALARDDLPVAGEAALRGLGGPPGEAAEVVTVAEGLLRDGALARLDALLAPSLAAPSPPAEALRLAAEAALARDGFEDALALARRLEGSDPAAGWLLGRALVGLDQLDEAQPRLLAVHRATEGASTRLLELERARQALEEISAFARRARADGVTGYARIPEKTVGLAQALGVVARRTAEVLAPMRGRAAGVRLQRAVLALDDEVLRLPTLGEGSRIASGPLEQQLLGVAAAAPGPDGRSLEALALCVRAEDEVRRPGGQRPEVAARLEEELSAAFDRLEAPRYRALVLAFRFKFLSYADQRRPSELERAERILVVDGSVREGLRSELEALRQRVVEGYASLAWFDPQGRRAALDRALALCAAATDNPDDGGLPRQRMRAALIAGVPSREGFARLNRVDQLLLDAEFALAADKPADAVASLESLFDDWKRGREPLRGKKGDALCALAVARALLGAHDAARAALEEARGSTLEPWLPWRDVDVTARTLELIVTEGWRPSPRECFPHRLAPGGRWLEEE